MILLYAVPVRVAHGEVILGICVAYRGGAMQVLQCLGRTPLVQQAHAHTNLAGFGHQRMSRTAGGIATKRGCGRGPPLFLVGTSITRA